MHILIASIRIRFSFAYRVKSDLMLLYSLPAFAAGNSIAFLSGVARTNRLVKSVCLLFTRSKTLETSWSNASCYIGEQYN